MGMCAGVCCGCAAQEDSDVEIWSFVLEGQKVKVIVYKYIHSRKLANNQQNHTTNIKKKWVNENSCHLQLLFQFLVLSCHSLLLTRAGSLGNAAAQFPSPRMTLFDINLSKRRFYPNAIIWLQFFGADTCQEALESSIWSLTQAVDRSVSSQLCSRCSVWAMKLCPSFSIC